MALAKSKTITRVCSVSYDVGKHRSIFFHATTQSAAVVLTAGYCNDFRTDLQVNDLIDVVSQVETSGVPMRLKVTAVPAAPGNVVVTTDVADEVASARAVVPTGDGLTTGLILASDDFIAVTSGGANDIVTLPPIADVPLGKEIWGQNGATACEMRTPATSNTTINNGDADANEAVLAANVAFMVKKVSATNWALLTMVGGAVAAPTPD